MNKNLILRLLLLFIFLFGCNRTQNSKIDILAQYSSKGQFHKAFKILPLAKLEWEALDIKENHSHEGAKGQMISTLLTRCAASGKDEWGNILSDETILQEYKAELVSEIFEYWMGKNSVSTDSNGDIIIIKEGSFQYILSNTIAIEGAIALRAATRVRAAHESIGYANGLPYED